MFRILYNGCFWCCVHPSKSDALKEAKDQQEYSAKIGQGAGPMSIQETLDGEWVTVQKVI